MQLYLYTVRCTIFICNSFDRVVLNRLIFVTRAFKIQIFQRFSLERKKEREIERKREEKNGTSSRSTPQLKLSVQWEFRISLKLNYGRDDCYHDSTLFTMTDLICELFQQTKQCRIWERIGKEHPPYLSTLSIYNDQI